MGCDEYNARMGHVYLTRRYSTVRNGQQYFTHIDERLPFLKTSTNAADVTPFSNDQSAGCIEGAAAACCVESAV